MHRGAEILLQWGEGEREADLTRERMLEGRWARVVVMGWVSECKWSLKI